MAWDSTTVTVWPGFFVDGIGVNGLGFFRSEVGYEGGDLW